MNIWKYSNLWSQKLLSSLPSNNAIRTSVQYECRLWRVNYGRRYRSLLESEVGQVFSKSSRSWDKLYFCLRMKLGATLPHSCWLQLYRSFPTVMLPHNVAYGRNIDNNNNNITILLLIIEIIYVDFNNNIIYYYASKYNHSQKNKERLSQ